MKFACFYGVSRTSCFEDVKMKNKGGRKKDGRELDIGEIWWVFYRTL